MISRDNKFSIFYANSNVQRCDDPGKVKILKTNLIQVHGLPKELANEKIIKQQQYLGQYGKITNVSVNEQTFKGNFNQSYQLTTMYVSYSHPSEASIAIMALDQFVIGHQKLKVFYGSTRYCLSFLQKKKCMNDKCLYIHKFQKDYEFLTEQSFQINYRKIAQSLILESLSHLQILSSKQSDDSYDFPSIQSTLEVLDFVKENISKIINLHILSRLRLYILKILLIIKITNIIYQNLLFNLFQYENQIFESNQLLAQKQMNDQSSKKNISKQIKTIDIIDDQQTDVNKYEQNQYSEESMESSFELQQYENQQIFEAINNIDSQLKAKNQQQVQFKPEDISTDQVWDQQLSLFEQNHNKEIETLFYQDGEVEQIKYEVEQNKQEVEQNKYQIEYNKYQVEQYKYEVEQNKYEVVQNKFDNQAQFSKESVQEIAEDIESYQNYLELQQSKFKIDKIINEITIDIYSLGVNSINQGFYRFFNDFIFKQLFEKIDDKLFEKLNIIWQKDDKILHQEHQQRIQQKSIKKQQVISNEKVSDEWNQQSPLIQKQQPKLDQKLQNNVKKVDQEKLIVNESKEKNKLPQIQKPVQNLQPKQEYIVAQPIVKINSKLEPKKSKNLVQQINTPISKNDPHMNPFEAIIDDESDHSDETIQINEIEQTETNTINKKKNKKKKQKKQKETKKSTHLEPQQKIIPTTPKYTQQTTTDDTEFSYSSNLVKSNENSNNNNNNNNKNVKKQVKQQLQIDKQSNRRAKSQETPSSYYEEYFEEDEIDDNYDGSCDSQNRYPYNIHHYYIEWDKNVGKSKTLKVNYKNNNYQQEGYQDILERLKIEFQREDIQDQLFEENQCYFLDDQEEQIGIFIID